MSRTRIYPGWIPRVARHNVRSATAEAALEEASGVIANGYLRLDHYGVRNLPPGRVRCPVCW
jgi:hypothetical protein